MQVHAEHPRVSSTPPYSTRRLVKGVPAGHVLSPWLAMHDEKPVSVGGVGPFGSDGLHAVATRVHVTLGVEVDGVGGHELVVAEGCTALWK